MSEEKFQEYFGVTPENYVRTFRRQNSEFVMELFKFIEEFAGGNGIVRIPFFDNWMLAPSIMDPSVETVIPN